LPEEINLLEVIDTYTLYILNYELKAMNGLDITDSLIRVDSIHTENIDARLFKLSIVKLSKRFKN
jgi:hypothetical protein